MGQVRTEVTRGFEIVMTSCTCGNPDLHHWVRFTPEEESWTLVRHVPPRF